MTVNPFHDAINAPWNHQKTSWVSDVSQEV